MPHVIHHGGHCVGSVPYVPKVIKRRGASIRYITAGNVIWLLKPDIQAHYAQLDRPQGVGPCPNPPRHLRRRANLQDLTKRKTENG